MKINELDSIKQYKNLLDKLENLTSEILLEYPEEINCRKKCTDCCNNIFNISVIEAYYLEDAYNNLNEKTKDQIIVNSIEAKNHIESEKFNKENIKCPLLIDDLCVMYEFRPLICRTFGFPMTSETTQEIATCDKNFPSLRNDEQTIKTISSKLLSVQSVVLSQYLLKELGRLFPDDYVPPLFSILEVLIKDEELT